MSTDPADSGHLELITPLTNFQDDPSPRRLTTSQLDPEPIWTEDAPSDDDDASVSTGDAPRRRRRWPRVLAALLLLLVLILGGAALYVKRQFDALERVEVSELLAPASPAGTNYLIVGTDSRENLDPNVENAGSIFGDGSVEFVGQRTDSIQILRLNADGTHQILALPRDLYLPIGGDGDPNRINAAFAFGGAESLIKTIEGSLGVPIHHYAEVDFAGFIDLVDAVGGVTIDFPNPSYDLKTGLNVPAGPVKLDSTQALAFVRSRTFVEIIGDQPVTDPRGDLGRVKRQQVFLQAFAVELDSPITQVSVLSDLGESLGSFRIDDSLSFRQAASLANRLRDLDLTNNHDLEVSHFTTPSGAQVLALDSEASKATLDLFSR